MKGLTIALLISANLAFGASKVGDSYLIDEPMGSIVKEVWNKSGFTGINIPKEKTTKNTIEITHINMTSVCDPKSKSNVESAMKLFSEQSNVKSVRGPYGSYARASNGAMKYHAENELPNKPMQFTSATQIYEANCSNILVSI